MPEGQLTTTDGTQLDPKVLKVMRAIRRVESGGDYNAVGDGGKSRGAFQWHGDNWKNAAKQILGDENAPMSKENQNKVAYTQMKAYKDAGRDPEEIAALWNGAKKDQNTGRYTYVAPQYGEKFRAALAEDGVNITPKAATPASVEEPKEEKSFLRKAGEFAFPILEKKERTPLQFAGDLAQSALWFTPVGGAANLATKGITKLLPKLAVGTAEKAGLATAGAATGYAADVANSASQNKVDLTPGLGTVLGGAAPAVVPAIGKALGKGAAQGLGLSTGTGADVVKAGYQAAREGGAAREGFKQALRKNISEESIVNDAKGALGKVVDARRDAYAAGIKKIEDETFVTKAGKTYVKKYDPELKKTLFVPTNLTTKGVKDVATRTLKSIGLDAKGRKIDFSKRPSLDARGIQKVHDFVYEWDDMTPTGLNTLRQEVAGFRKGGLNPSPADNRYNLYIDNLTRNIKNYVGDKIPQVKEMNDAYAKSSGLIKEITKSLSLGDKVQTDTAFRKLTTVLRTNNEFRKEVLTKLENEVGENLQGKIAGQQLSEVLPRGLVRTIGGIGAAGGILSGVAIVPLMKAALLTSPRVVGEMLLALGYTMQQANRVGKLLGARVLLFPALGGAKADE